MLEVRPLIYFIAAYELRSITAAAKNNFIAQPSISHAIKNLEQQLNCNLFIRSRQGLTPTEDGHKLYRQSVKLIESMSSIEESFAPKPTVYLNFFCQSDILLGHFSEHFKRLYRNNKPLLIKFVESPKDADLALLHDHLCPKTHNFHPIATESYVVGMSSNHPLTLHKALKLPDVIDHPIIGRSYCPYKDRLHNELLSRKLILNEVVQATNDQHLLELVSLGIGIAFIPENQANKNKEIVTRRIETKASFKRRIGISVKRTALAESVYNDWTDNIKTS